jgi:hypothetical protein
LYPAAFVRRAAAPKRFAPGRRPNPAPTGRSDFRGKAAAGKAYKATCAKECWAQRVPKIDAEQVSVSVTFHPATARAYDLDNALAMGSLFGIAAGDAANLLRWAT